MNRILVLFLLLTNVLLSQTKENLFVLDSLDDKNKYNQNGEMETPGKRISQRWKFHIGDDMKWADPNFNDSTWKTVLSSLDVRDSVSLEFEDRAWFRMIIEVDSEFLNKPLILMMDQWGASEIYINGILFKRYGIIHPISNKKNIYYNPNGITEVIQFSKAYNVMAVRYHNHHAQNDVKDRLTIGPGFKMKLSSLELVSNYRQDNGFYYDLSFVFYFTFFFALSLLHLFFYLFYRTNRSNLYYSIFTLSFGLLFLLQLLLRSSTDPESMRSMLMFYKFNPTIYSASLLAMLYSIFYPRIPKIFWLWFGMLIVSLILLAFKVDSIFSTILGLANVLVVIIEPIRIIVAAIIKKKEGAWILGTGVTVTILFLIAIIAVFATGNPQLVFENEGILGVIIIITIMLSTISIPLSMSVFLARQFSITNKDLEKKLIEVKDLSAKNLEQEREKQVMLADQNIVLEKQVKERTHEITEQKKIIEEKNKDITDSIAYAKRIQDATLPPKELKYKLFPNAFVLFKPKDIVSGDFYWFAETEDHKFIAAADCTGHGVPGAMVSVVCSNALNRAVKEFGLREPGKILDQVRDLVLETFAKSENSNVKDGMDISLCCVPKKSAGTITIQWAGANNPFWYLQDNEIKEITATKQPIGATDNPTPFVTHTIKCKEGDVFYLFSDGYADQFGGPKGKKLKYKQLLDHILSIQDRSMPEQEKFLDERFEEWKGALAQIDDVLVIGVKI